MVRSPLHESDRVPTRSTTPGSCQLRVGSQNCFYCSDLDFILCYHNYIVDLDFSERALIVDCLSAVDTGKAVAGIELLRHMDTGNMA